jgi:uncharacterized protein YcbK (DUF882 family)
MPIKLLGCGFVAIIALGLSSPQISEAKRNPNKARKIKPVRARSKVVKKRRRKKDRFPPMRLVNVNSGEKLSLRIYDKRGYTRPKALKKLYRFLRCRRTGRRRLINWKLIQRLYSISRRYRGRTIQVFSGYRHRRVARSKGSRHIRGKAIDFRIDGVSKVALRDYLRGRYKTAGVGYYPNSHFIHFDVRKKSAFWVDLSGPGQRPKYVKDPYAWLRQKKRNKKVASKKSGINAVGQPLSKALAGLSVQGLSDVALKVGLSSKGGTRGGIAVLRASSADFRHADVGGVLRLPVGGDVGAPPLERMVPEITGETGMSGHQTDGKIGGRAGLATSR